MKAFALTVIIVETPDGTGFATRVSGAWIDAQTGDILQSEPDTGKALRAISLARDAVLQGVDLSPPIIIQAPIKPRFVNGGRG